MAQPVSPRPAPALCDVAAIDEDVSSVGTSELAEYDLMADAPAISGSQQLSMLQPAPADWRATSGAGSAPPSDSWCCAGADEAGAYALNDYLAFPPHDAGHFACPDALSAGESIVRAYQSEPGSNERAAAQGGGRGGGDGDGDCSNGARPSSSWWWRSWNLGRSVSAPVPATASTLSVHSVARERARPLAHVRAAVHVLTGDPGVAGLMWPAMRAIEASLALAYVPAVDDADGDLAGGRLGRLDVMVEATWGAEVKPGEAHIVLVPLPVTEGPSETALVGCANATANTNAAALLPPLVVPVKMARTAESLATLASSTSAHQADQSLRDLVTLGNAVAEHVHWTELVQRCGLRWHHHCALGSGGAAGVRLLSPLSPGLERIVRLHDFAREVALAHGGRSDWARQYAPLPHAPAPLGPPTLLPMHATPPITPPNAHSNIEAGQQHSNMSHDADPRDQPYGSADPAGQRKAVGAIGSWTGAVRPGLMLLAAVMVVSLLQAWPRMWLEASSALVRLRRHVHSGPAATTLPLWPPPPWPVHAPAEVTKVGELAHLPAQSSIASDVWANGTVVGPFELPAEHPSHALSASTARGEMYVASPNCIDAHPWRTDGGAWGPRVDLDMPHGAKDVPDIGSASAAQSLHADSGLDAGLFAHRDVPGERARRCGRQRGRRGLRFGARPTRKQVQALLRSTRWRWKSRVRRAWPWPKRGGNVFTPHVRKSPLWMRPTAREMRTWLRA